MTRRASGSFEIKLEPLSFASSEVERVLGRMAINKQFSGDLAGTSRGEMLSIMGSAKGSAGYVAMEWVTGTLHGRAGSFALQHSGTMTRGEPQLAITVVPDSGCGELIGLSGALTITLTEGKHFYAFDYELPA
ncbi:MAG: DUF3224 domain-containing protein [Betaproteobacteria bacterium]|nr:DUF3224 domain-containing protein [Betaproteobacteria bacterium]